RIGTAVEVALANQFTANRHSVGHSQFNAATELVDAFVDAAAGVGADTAEGIDQNRIGHHGASAQVGEELARAEVGGPDVVAGDFSADQERIDGDEVHADGSTDDTRSGVDRGRGIERCGVTGELATSASTDIETFPIEAGSFIDRLRRGRDDEVGGLSTTSEQRGSSHTESKRTYKHILHS